MKNYFLLLLLVPFISLAKLVTIKKGTPIAASIECWEKLNQSMITNNEDFYNQLVKEYCIVVLSKDLNAYLLEEINWKGMAVLRIPGKISRLYVHSNQLETANL